MKREQPRSTGRGPYRPPHRGHAQTLLAVYGGAARPGQTVRLNLVGHPTARPELSFQPLAQHGERQCCVGLLQNATGYRLRTPVVEVIPEGGKPGSAGELVIAGKLPKRMVMQPGPVLKGFAKSVAQAHGDLALVDDGPRRWHAALTLALDGEIAPELLDVRDTEIAAPALSLHDNLLVWQPFVARLAGRLADQVQKLVQRNPFADGLSLELAAALLETGNLRMARLALEHAAGEQSWPETSRVGQKLYLFSAGASAPADEDQAVAQELLAAVERGDGGLAQLRGRFLGRPHVMPWLLEAGRLVCSADGFLFTLDELNKYWNELGLTPGAQPPGVGELKERLGLNRRKAEGLRRLLADRHGQAAGPQGAGAGR